MDAVELEEKEKQQQENDGVKEIKSNPPQEYTDEEVRNLLGWMKVAKERDDAQCECEKDVKR